MRQLCPRPHRKLAVDPGQVRFDGLDGDEQLRGGLLVRVSCTDELGNATFRDGEPAGAGVQPRPARFVAGSFRPARDAQLVEGGRGGVQRLVAMPL